MSKPTSRIVSAIVSWEALVVVGVATGVALLACHFLAETPILQTTKYYGAAFLYWGLVGLVVGMHAIFIGASLSRAEHQPVLAAAIFVAGCYAPLVFGMGAVGITWLKPEVSEARIGEVRLLVPWDYQPGVSPGFVSLHLCLSATGQPTPPENCSKGERVLLNVSKAVNGRHAYASRFSQRFDAEFPGGTLRFESPSAHASKGDWSAAQSRIIDLIDSWRK